MKVEMIGGGMVWWTAGQNLAGRGSDLYSLFHKMLSIPLPSPFFTDEELLPRDA